MKVIPQDISILHLCQLLRLLLAFLPVPEKRLITVSLRQPWREPPQRRVRLLIRLHHQGSLLSVPPRLHPLLLLPFLSLPLPRLSCRLPLFPPFVWRLLPLRASLRHPRRKVALPEDRHRRSFCLVFLQHPLLVLISREERGVRGGARQSVWKTCITLSTCSLSDTSKRRSRARQREPSVFTRGSEGLEPGPRLRPLEGRGTAILSCAMVLRKKTKASNSVQDCHNAKGEEK